MIYQELGVRVGVEKGRPENHKNVEGGFSFGPDIEIHRNKYKTNIKNGYTIGEMKRWLFPVRCTKYRPKSETDYFSRGGL